MKINNFRDLEVWQVAMEVVDVVYDIIEALPSSERFALANQLKRSAVSVPSNIAEGSARNNTKELIQYLYIARGSLAEVETQIELAKRRKFCSEILYNKAIEYIRRVGQMTARLIQSLQP